MHPLRGRISTQTVLMLAWAGLLLFGVGRTFVRSASAGVTRIIPQADVTSEDVVEVKDGWRWVNQPGATRPGRALVPAGACSSYTPPAPPPEPVNQTLQYEMDSYGQAIATFIDDSQIYLYMPQKPTSAGVYEFRLWVVDSKNYGQGNTGQTDVTAELVQGDFPSLDSPTLRDLSPKGSYVGKALLASGSNTLAVRLRRALPSEDISQIAAFEIQVPN